MASYKATLCDEGAEDLIFTDVDELGSFCVG